MRTAPGRRAASGSKTAGSSSYSTSISARASSALAAVSAATAAISSRMQRTLPPLRAVWSLAKPNGFCSTSAAVSTASTPGSAAARRVSTRTIRAWGWRARKILPAAILGRTRSCRKRVRPVTLSPPSFFGVALPMTARLTRDGASCERADAQALVEHGRPLVQRGGAPDVEERRAEHLEKLLVGALLGLLGRLAGPGGIQRAADPVLVIDGGELRVAIERTQVPRVEHHDGDRLERLAVPVVQELRHEIGVGRIGLRLRAASHRLAIAREDAQLEADGVGELRQQRDVATAVRRPLLGDGEHLGRPVGLRHEPLPRRLVGRRQTHALVRRAQEPTEVLARRLGALTLQVFRGADVLDVLRKRHALRQPPGVYHLTGSLCSPKTSCIARLISPSVAYAFTASMIGSMRFDSPRAASLNRRSASRAPRSSRSRRTRESPVSCVAATPGSNA